MRRLTLDLNGRIPTAEETRAYLADPNPSKRDQLVERLLTAPAFVRHQAVEFDAVLMPPSPDGGKPGRTSSLREYLQTAFADNRPWDRVFRELLLPDAADPKQKGAAEFLRSRVKDLDRLTTDVSSLFFGVNISCAQCHDHPLVADWKQDHFYGMKSFFARSFEAGQFVGERDFGAVKFVPNKGKEKQAQVMFLSGKVLEVPNLREPTKEEQKKDREAVEAARKSNKPPEPPSVSLRAKLVETALEPGGRDFFARAAANRLWYRFFGQGLVMPLDQMHSANKPSHPDLLAWLARDLAGHGYDLRRLVRGLVSSRAYARASRSDDPSEPD